MDTSDLIAILDNREKWRQEAQQLRATAAEQMNRAANIEALLAAADALANSDPPPPGAPRQMFESERVPVKPPSPAPNGSMSTPDAVLAVMLTAPKRSWKAADVLKEMEKQGWLVTKAADPGHKVLTTMSRLAKAGKLKRGGYGKYRVAPNLIDGGTAT